VKTLLGLLVLVLPIVSAADVVVPIDSVDRYVNIRQSPEAGTEVVGRLQRGIPLTLVQSIPGWYEVELDDEGTTGFVSSDWADVIVEESAPEPVVEAVAGPEPAPEPVVEEVAEPEPAPEPVVEEVAEPEPGSELVIEEAEMPESIPEPPGESKTATLRGTSGFLVKFREPTVGTSSQIYDEGNQIGIGTTEPKQRLEVNGSIQIHEQNSRCHAQSCEYLDDWCGLG